MISSAFTNQTPDLNAYIAFLLHDALRVRRYRKLNSIQREKHMTTLAGLNGDEIATSGEVFEAVVRVYDRY